MQKQREKKHTSARHSGQLQHDTDVEPSGLCGFFYFQSSRMCNVQRDFSMLNVLCSMFKVQVQMFNVHRSMYNVQRLSDIQRCFNVQRLSDIQGCLNGSLILFYFILTV